MNLRTVTGRALLAVGAAGLCLVGAASVPTRAGSTPLDDRERDLVGYFTATPTDPVALLQARMDRGERVLAYDRKHGYLPDILAALRVPVSSQGLVFSKTSFQLERISPRAPRAIFFNDDVYVGHVQGSEILEFSAVDPKLGAVFYILRNVPGGKPRFVRQTYDCLQCHESGMTSGVPGHMVRSVFPTSDGRPDFGAGTYLVTDETPWTERFGGWYVTGAHGSMRHMGNAFTRGGDGYATLDREPGANRSHLSDFVDTRPYLAPGSDIVAQLVLQHQARVHNRIVRAGWGTRLALADQRIIDESLGRLGEGLSESTRGRIRSVCEPLVEALLFVREAPLTSPVTGSSDFTRTFAARGARDRHGRSLRQFDLRTRLFRYPCSFLIHSDAFAALPTEARAYVIGRLRTLLGASEPAASYDHLSADDRRALREILEETLPDWKRFPEAVPAPPGRR
ncbi:MAG: hypothetical protein ACKO5K_09480 [Armatimonadota bacterium]